MLGRCKTSNCFALMRTPPSCFSRSSMPLCCVPRSPSQTYSTHRVPAAFIVNRPTPQCKDQATTKDCLKWWLFTEGTRKAGTSLQLQLGPCPAALPAITSFCSCKRPHLCQTTTTARITTTDKMTDDEFVPPRSSSADEEDDAQQEEVPGPVARRTRRAAKQTATDNAPDKRSAAESSHPRKRTTKEADVEKEPKQRAKRRKRFDPEAPAPRLWLPIEEDEFKREAVAKGPDPMTYDELIKILDYRDPEWTADPALEQHHEDLLNARVDVLEALQPKKEKAKSNTGRLWKTCVGRFKESPDFILSGHIRLEPRPEALEFGATGGGLMYPLPFGEEDLIVLMNQPFWKGNIAFVRTTLAFAVACRTIQAGPLPYTT